MSHDPFLPGGRREEKEKKSSLFAKFMLFQFPPFNLSKSNPIW
jgi:hypothetical protein